MTDYNFLLAIVIVLAAIDLFWSFFWVIALYMLSK